MRWSAGPLNFMFAVTDRQFGCDWVLISAVTETVPEPETVFSVRTAENRYFLS